MATSPAVVRPVQPALQFGFAFAHRRERGMQRIRNFPDLGDERIDLSVDFRGTGRVARIDGGLEPRNA